MDFTLYMRILNNDDILLVAICHTRQIISEVFQGAMPLGVIGHTDHIELDIPGKHVVKKENRFIVLATKCNVQHDSHRRVNGFNTIDTSLYEVRQAVKIPNMSLRPDHTVIDLISNLYHIRY